MRLPDFIICGAPRSGTTWLVEALKRHTSIYMAQPTFPEPKFFHIPALYAKGLGYYSKTWFSNVPPGVVAGEKDTYYLENSDAAGRIFTHLPNAKLIFILREPCERAFSNYLWSTQNGFETESFETALELEPTRESCLPERLRFVRPHAYFSRGLYAKQLNIYFSLFPRDQILCIPFDLLASNPGRLLTTVHNFLGVEQHAEDGISLGEINKGVAEDTRSIPDNARLQLQQEYLEPNRQLAELLPGFPVWHYEE